MLVAFSTRCAAVCTSAEEAQLLNDLRAYIEWKNLVGKWEANSWKVVLQVWSQ